MMKKLIIITFLSLFAAFSLTAEQIPITNLKGRQAAITQGTAWGVPFSKGEVMPNAEFSATDAQGVSVPVESWPLAYWSDGSLKWAGFAVVSKKGLEELTLDIKSPTAKAKRSQASMAKAPVPEMIHRGFAVEEPGGVRIDNGLMKCFFPSQGDAIIKDMTIGGRIVSDKATLVAKLESRKDGEGSSSVKYENFISKVEKVSIVQNTEMRVAVKIEGRHKSAVAEREWLPFTLFCVMYKGVPTITITHSFLFDSDGKQDFIKGMGVRFNVPFKDEDHNRHVRFAGDGKDDAGFWCQPVRLAPGYRPSAGRVFSDNYQSYLQGQKLPTLAELKESERNALLTCPVWGDMRLSQNSPGAFSIDKRTTSESSWVHVTDGARSVGGALLGDTSGSIFVGLKDFWQSYPAALYVDNAGADNGSLTVWMWSPDAEAMDMRHYDTEGHDLKINYEDFKEGWESPYGVGHRSTLEVRLFDCIPSNEELWSVAQAVQKPVQYSCSPQYYYSVNAFGDFWGLPDYSNPVMSGIEKQLDSTLEYYKQQVEERSWYGFWNYGDVMHNYDFTRHDWRYDIGGWAWNNIELAPNVLLWACFLRTGREDIWSMAEALEKHASEVDVHHIGRFAPLGSRHNVKHWGDGCKQPRIEYAAMKRFLYYLTGGDFRTGDLMTEQIGSEKAYDYAKRVSTWGAVGGTYLKGSLNDWAYYAGNWMLEWERTGNTEWRDKLLNSMKDIVALGRKSGKLVFDYFDPETGRFMVYLKEDPKFRGEVNAPKSDFAPASTLSAAKLDRIVGYRLGRARGETFSTLFGSPEFMADFRASVDYPEFWKLTDNFFSDNVHTPGGNMTGPRMAAWLADSRNDKEMGELAWKNLLNNGFTATESDGTTVVDHSAAAFSSKNIIKAVNEPDFLGQTAGWQRHTPSTTQWLLNALEVMEWAKQYVPSTDANSTSDSR